jgi:hypothetical protein
MPLLRPKKPSAPRLREGASFSWLPTIGPPHAKNQFDASGTSALAIVCVTAKKDPCMGGNMTRTTITIDSAEKAVKVKMSTRMQIAMKGATSGSTRPIVGIAMVGLVTWRTTRLNNHFSPLIARIYSRKGMPCSASS